MKNNEQLPMSIEDVKIKSTHLHSFRRNEWGYITSIVKCTPKGLAPRLCYMVRYLDGFVDYLPVTDSSDNYVIMGLSDTNSIAPIKKDTLKSEE